MLEMNRRFSFYVMKHPSIDAVSQFCSAVLPEKRGDLGPSKRGGKATQESLGANALLGKPGKRSRIKLQDFPEGIKVWKVQYLRNKQLNPYHQEYGEEYVPVGYQPPAEEEHEGMGFYVYPSYILEMSLGREGPSFAFAAPFSRLLGQAIDRRVEALRTKNPKAERLSFGFLDLSDFCRSYTRYRLPRDIGVTRAEMKTRGTIHLERLILYGSDVLRSEEYQGLKDVSDPQSIRIASDTTAKTPFTIGVDDFGNWFFQFRMREELAYVFKIMRFLRQKGLLRWSFEMPHRRVKRDGDSEEEDGQ